MKLVRILGTVNEDGTCTPFDGPQPCSLEQLAKQQRWGPLDDGDAVALDAFEVVLVKRFLDRTARGFGVARRLPWFSDESF